MNMIVCVKQVIDPEAPPASFKIDPSANKVVPPPSVPPVLSPFDENAVEVTGSFENGFKVQTDEGNTLEAKTVIVATGASNPTVSVKDISLSKKQLFIDLSVPKNVDSCIHNLEKKENIHFNEKTTIV